MFLPLPESREDICFVSVRLIYSLAHFPLTFSLFLSLPSSVLMSVFILMFWSLSGARIQRVTIASKVLGYFLLAGFGYLYFFFWGSFTLLLWVWTHQIFVIRYVIYSFFHYLDLFFIVISSFD